jgi:type VI secretion system lysozyme-like protein
MPPTPKPIAPAPLFELLEDDAPFSSLEIPPRRTLSPDALRDSVRADLMRLLNTRRGQVRGRRPLDVLSYGLPDWSARYAAHAADRSAIERDIVAAILAFEPRLAHPRAEVAPDPDAPWRLQVRITGQLRAGTVHWPVAFVAQLVDGQPIGVVNERVA